jgi:flagellar M-ring protein FliF
MRAETLSPIAWAIHRVRGQTRRLADRAPASSWRWLIGLAALALVAGLVFFQVGTATPTGAFVRSGTRFSDDDVIAISQALDAKHLPFRIVDDGRIEVSADRLDDANDAIAKLDVGPRRLDDIEKKRTDWNLLETPDDKLERAEKARAEQLAAYIQRLQGIVSARVTINRPRAREIRRPAQGASAFVYLETQGRREIPHQRVKTIQTLIVGSDPEVKPTAITIMDQTGHTYLDAQNPSIGALSRQRAREEEYRDEIAKKLDWLTGVQVSVQLIATAEPTPIPAEATRLMEPVPAPAPAPAPVSVPGTTEEPRSPEASKMSMNSPLDFDPEPELTPVSSRTPAGLALAPAPSIHPDPSLADDEMARSKARVLVTVPRSFYLSRMPSRDPSLEDLQAFVTRTEANIKMAVAIVIPPDRLGEVNVGTIADDLPSLSPPPPANPDPRRSLSWWVLVGVAAGATAASIALAFRLLAVRRPEVSASPSERGDRGRYKIDEAGAGAPGPSERVRELIRQNPEAAASVLHRWTGQGGPIG